MRRDEPTSSAVLLPTHYITFIDPKVEITRKRTPPRVHVSKAVAMNCSCCCLGYKLLDSIKTSAGLLSASGNFALIKINETNKKQNKECGCSLHREHLEPSKAASWRRTGSHSGSVGSGVQAEEATSFGVRPLQQTTCR